MDKTVPKHSKTAPRGQSKPPTASKGRKDTADAPRGQSSPGIAPRGKKTNKSNKPAEEEVLDLAPCDADILSQSDNESVKSTPVSESMLDSDQNTGIRSTNSTRSSGPSSSRSSSKSRNSSSSSQNSSSTTSDGDSDAPVVEKKSEKNKCIFSQVKAAIDKYMKKLQKDKERKRHRSKKAKRKPSSENKLSAAKTSASPDPVPVPAPELPDVQHRDGKNATKSTPDETPTYKTVREIHDSQAKIKNIFGGSERIPRTGSFRNEGDFRSNLTRESSDKRAGITSSFSYTYRNLYCDSCPETHPILGKNIRPVFVLVDQNFPAAVPVHKGGRCLAILRIEDGKLHELADLFLQKVRSDWLPSEAIYLLSSASHLASTGTATYAEDFVKTRNRLLDSLPRGSTVLHGPIFLLNGCTDSALIRSLYEVCQWLVHVDGKNSSVGDISEFYMQWNDSIFEARTGEKQEAYHIRLTLPTNLELPITKKTWASEPGSTLPASTKPIPEPLEAELLQKLIGYLNNNFGASLEDRIITDRTGTQARSTQDSHKIEFALFVGGKTATSLYGAAKAEKIPCGLVTVDNADPDTIARATTDIKKIAGGLFLDGKAHVIVYCLYDGNCYIEENGRRSYQSSDGTTHLEGPVHFPTKSRLEPSVLKTLPLFDCAKESMKSVITPMPRFISGPCCEKATHATNAGSAEYQESLKQNISSIGRYIREIAGANNIRKLRVLNVTSTVLDVQKADAQGGHADSPGTYTAVLNAILAESAAHMFKRPLPTPKRPPPKRHHSDQAANIDIHRRHGEVPEHTQRNYDPYEADRYRQELGEDRRVRYREESNWDRDWSNYSY